MDLLHWITVGFIIIGFVILAFLKRNMEGKKGSTVAQVWRIAGSSAWGVASIVLIVWSFSTM